MCSLEIIRDKIKGSVVLEQAYSVSRAVPAQIYLVGGTVRDILLGFYRGKDYDFVVKDDFERTVEIFAKKVHGKIITWDCDQKRIVVRNKNGYDCIDFSRCKGKNIEEDLERRDFTINAMAVDIKQLFSDVTLDIIDPLGARDDISAKTIRACSSTAFDEDPLRILRAIRFARQFGFAIDKQSRHMMHEKAAMIQHVSRERIKREMFTILHLPDACTSVKELYGCSVFSFLIPAITHFMTVSQGAPHKDNVLKHAINTVMCVSMLLDHSATLHGEYEQQIDDYFNDIIEEGVSRRSLLIFTAFFHDSGKEATRAYAGGKVTFHGHEREGARINRSVAQSLGLGKRAQRIVQQITENHMRILQLSQLASITQRAKMRLMRDIKGVSLEVAFLAIADVQATSDAASYEVTRENVTEVAQQIVAAVLSNQGGMECEQPVTGREVMEILHIPEGPEIGSLIAEIQDRERSGLLQSKQEALSWIRQKKT